MIMMMMMISYPSVPNYAEIRRTCEKGLCYLCVSFDVLVSVSVRTTVPCN